jgi:hypothetical protein
MSMEELLQAGFQAECAICGVTAFVEQEDEDYGPENAEVDFARLGWREISHDGEICLACAECESYDEDSDDDEEEDDVDRGRKSYYDDDEEDEEEEY